MQLQVDREYLQQIKPQDFYRKLFKVILNQENRIRVLEGKAQITKEQLITALKAL